MTQEIQKYKTRTIDELKKHKQVKLVFGRYHLEWDSEGNLTWFCQEEDAKKEINSHIGSIIGLMALVNQKNGSHFLTVDDAHTIYIAQSRNGSLIKQLSGHEGRITGLLELVNGNLLSVSDDGTVKYWDLKTYKCIATLDVHIKSVDDIEVLEGIERTFIINVGNDTQLWSLKGDLRVELKGLKEEIRFYGQLNSGNWLVEPMKGHPILWSSDGKPICKYKFSFSVRDGFIELENGQLLIKDQSNVLQIWTQSGELVEKHTSDNVIAEHFDELEAAKDKTSRWLHQHRSSDDYPQISNNFNWDNIDPDKEKIDKPNENSGFPRLEQGGTVEQQRQGLKLKQGSDQRTIWDFFFRPNIRSIKMALRQQIDTARSAEENLTKQKEQAELKIKKHTSKRKFAKFAAFFFAIPTILMCLISYYSYAMLKPATLITHTDSVVNSILGVVSPNDAGTFTISTRNISESAQHIQIALAGISGILLLITLSWFWRNRSQKTKQLEKTGNLQLINVMMENFEKLINTIKNHRTSMLESVPANKNPRLFASADVHTLIEDKINNEIQQIALDKLNLDKSELIHRDGGAVLQDWSIIQTGKPKKINRQNEVCVHFDGHGNLVSAVRVIQFIFLTKEQVNVFYTYYDFIADEFIEEGETDLSLFYTDISTVIRSNVESKLFKQDLLNTKITLSLNSGKNISLVILKEESVKALSSELVSNEDEAEVIEEMDDEASLELVRTLLEQEEAEISTQFEADLDMAKEDNNEELVNQISRAQAQLLDYVRKQQASVDNYNSDESVSNISKDNLADLTYRNIKTQIEAKKSEATAA
ncbi:WD40 repeat domain-containing protein [Shewanella sp. 10N.286.52.B9]|uniref:WD40 repeat domain-containing protein n=1 Tax=Shewanella sp. 10N.286.52.B9 TaxID=1880837 RepID=UPI000C815065|nr:WD40 repeat domain-containing protein [Shewanella sp. 10N.286.52.B9]PMG39574.1 hypothetical protein BCU91_14655 [Shewanella sp. 10N.286.52.B9]